ncbi:uncharacterized protein COLE_02788 [Cutaneotrichosporon oleaginosum]|uniref:uncharacterized protein n=1 Tax=Cutaneotrichosporon oleaginosum TaxID=879819 RepID=UPI00132A78DA|nr:hypothetical protein COLE_02788 [Cutaneotrichosporon oleaginosum]
MRVAVVGCLHGSFAELYRTLPPVDLVLCCGDLQAFRNASDMESCHLLPDQRKLGSFHKYYAAPRDIPLTIVVGGNHEASNYLGELFYGGWLAHNIYYLGVAGSVMVNGLRIAGASGIYRKGTEGCGYFERVPLSEKRLHTIYHIRKWNEERLRFDVDIFLSHDWPAEIIKHGDWKRLFRFSPQFKPLVSSGKLGAPPLMRILDATRPRYWFAAHRHIKFPAVKTHPPKAAKGERGHEQDPTPAAWLSTHTIYRNPPPGRDLLNTPPQPGHRATRFLALSKPSDDGWTGAWQVVLDISAPSEALPPALTFDYEWLAITKGAHPIPTNCDPLARDAEGGLPSMLPDNFEERTLAILNALVDPRFSGPISDIQTFAKTAPAAGGGAPLAHYTNPQTTAFCAMLGIEDLTNPPPMQHPLPPRPQTGGDGDSWHYHDGASKGCSCTSGPGDTDGWRPIGSDGHSRNTGDDYYRPHDTYIPEDY